MLTAGLSAKASDTVLGIIEPKEAPLSVGPGTPPAEAGVAAADADVEYVISCGWWPAPPLVEQLMDDGAAAEPPAYSVEATDGGWDATKRFWTGTETPMGLVPTIVVGREEEEEEEDS